jgi:chromosome segregation ATPase
MPIKDGDARRPSFRDYMRKRRAPSAEIHPNLRAAEAALREVEAVLGEAEAAALTAEVAWLRAECAKLREQVAALMAENEQLRGRVAELELQAAMLDLFPQAPETPESLSAKLESAERQLQGARSQVKNFKLHNAHLNRLLESKPPLMTRKLHREIRGFLHPDRAPDDAAQRKRLERCFQRFSAVKFTFDERDDT